MPLEFPIGIPLHGVKQNLGQTVLILFRIAGKLQRRQLHANPLALETITALDFNVLFDILDDCCSDGFQFKNVLKVQKLQKITLFNYSKERKKIVIFFKLT